MKIYDEITRQELTDPDLEAGYLYDGTIVTGRTEEHYEIMEGTVTEERPEGLRRLVPARDITEPCQWYHTYTEEELAALQPPEVPADVDARLTALEDQLAAAKILLGVE